MEILGVIWDGGSWGMYECWGGVISREVELEGPGGSKWISWVPLSNWESTWPRAHMEGMQWLSEGHYSQLYKLFLYPTLLAAVLRVKSEETEWCPRTLMFPWSFPLHAWRIGLLLKLQYLLLCNRTKKKGTERWRQWLLFYNEIWDNCYYYCCCFYIFSVNTNNNS